MAALHAAEGLPAEALLPPIPWVTQVRQSLWAQVRTFLWLASGMFSVSALALAFLDFMYAGSADQAATHFLAAVAAAALFGSATLLKLGPDEM